jgi:hypothetical protein
VGVSHPTLAGRGLDVAVGELPKAFVTICLSCYNLGRLDHDVWITVPEPGALQYQCRRCGAMQLDDAPMTGDPRG